MKAIIIYQARQIRTILPVAAWVRAERGQRKTHKKTAFVSLKSEKKSTIVRLFHAAHDFHRCANEWIKKGKRVRAARRILSCRRSQTLNLEFGAYRVRLPAASPPTAASWRKKHKSGSFDTQCTPGLSSQEGRSHRGEQMVCVLNDTE